MALAGWLVAQLGRYGRDNYFGTRCPASRASLVRSLFDLIDMSCYAGSSFSKIQLVIFKHVQSIPGIDGT